MQNLQKSPLMSRTRRFPLGAKIASLAISPRISVGINLVYANGMRFNASSVGMLLGSLRPVGLILVVRIAAPALFTRDRMARLSSFLIPWAIRAWPSVGRLSRA